MAYFARGKVHRITNSPGVGYALLAAALFGTSTPLAKGLLASVSPQVLAGLLYLGSGLGLGMLWLWPIRGLKARRWILIAWAGAFLLNVSFFINLH